MDSEPRDAAYWAKNVTTLKLGKVPAKAVNLNVTGRRVVGPVQGFGKMWQKTARVELRGADVTPDEVIRTWKAEFQRFWPERNWFYAPLTGIAPGEVALLNLNLPGRMKLSTGVLVLYADDESFTLMTPEGHMLAGCTSWATCSAATASTPASGCRRPRTWPATSGSSRRSSPRWSAWTAAASGARPATSPRTRPSGRSSGPWPPRSAGCGAGSGAPVGGCGQPPAPKLAVGYAPPPGALAARGRVRSRAGPGGVPSEEEAR